MTQENLKIILRTYSKGGLNEDEAVQLIEGLCDKNIIYHYPYNPYFYQTTFPEEQKFTEYKVTCKN